MSKDCFVGAVVERGQVIATSSDEYVVESIDRPGIVCLPCKPINPETFSVDDIVYFFVCQDGTGRIVSKVDRISPVIPKADIVNDTTTGGTTKVASAEVAKTLQNQIGTVPSGKTLQGQISDLNFTEVTSKFTVNTTYVSQFKAYANANVVYVSGTIKPGASDQTNLVTGIPSSYQSKTGTYVALSYLYLNSVDATKNVTPYLVGSAIQVRCTSALSGTSGVVFSGSWVRNV